MSLKLTTTHLTVEDPEKSLLFYRDLLGMEVVADVAKGESRWLSLSSPDQKDLRLVLSQPHAGRSKEDAAVLSRLMAKGTLNSLIFTVGNLDETFEKLRASGADIVQPPTDQPWGVRDCGVRDPSGNMVRINQG